MGIDMPRSPAVHRGARILDAISSGVATTPAALSAALGMPKSSIADLLGALEDVGFVARGGDGSLHTGPRWSELSDPHALAHRIFRACAAHRPQSRTPAPPIAVKPHQFDRLVKDSGTRCSRTVSDRSTSCREACEQNSPKSALSVACRSSNRGVTTSLNIAIGITM